MELKEITTSNLVQLDHILREKTFNHELYATSYNNFATDHRSIVLRIGTIFLTEFLQFVNFDSTNHTRDITDKGIELNKRDTQKILKKRKQENKILKL